MGGGVYSVYVLIHVCVCVVCSVCMGCSVCVCACPCGCPCVCVVCSVCMCVLVHVKARSRHQDVFAQSLLHLIFRDSISHWISTHRFARLAHQQAAQIHTSLPPQPPLGLQTVPRLFFSPGWKEEELGSSCPNSSQVIQWDAPISPLDSLSRE